MKIIAICGPKRAGKDVLADYLKSKYNYKKKKIAQQLKDALVVLFGFTPDQLETDEKEQVDARWGISPRAAMQFFGTDVMQYKIQELLPNIGRIFWIQSLMAQLAQDTNYVISDLRFMHEYTALYTKYGKDLFVIKIERPTIEDHHCSEQEYKNIPCDLHLENTTTISDLLIKLDNALAGK